ncbi:cupin domain-containing protein [Thalassospira alkalitolerans]|uniref:cupin domain-containing protein n=1 Tax=Thalassospira alkalitolerans TaxID=1293890 RepID=UPI003AA85141
MTKVSQHEANNRHITSDDYVSCTVAFIDCKKPGSHLKENYSIIGPGVTSSDEQVVNLPEPHGFNIGAAAMPNGITNNLHIHFTAEVFVVQKGEWTFRWGSNGENEVVGRAGDIVSVPTWVFRGFTNTGPDDGWLFTVLGGDNTGGVIFHPEIIREAADYGLYISSDNTLIDASRGDTVPDESGRIPPMPDAEMADLRTVSRDEMMSRVVTEGARDFRPAFIDAHLPGGGAQIAPVIGFGLTQNRNHSTPITNPHGFSIEWLRMEAGQKVSPFTLDDKMVVIARSGKLRLLLNDGADVTIDLEARDTYSIPAGVVRSIETLGDETAEALVVVAGDHRKRPAFAAEVISAARDAGHALDAGGYVAKAALLPDYKRAG